MINHAQLNQMSKSDFARSLYGSPEDLKDMVGLDHGAGKCGPEHFCHLLEQLLSALDDLTPRVAWAVGGTYTITKANNDELLAIPNGTKILTLRFVTTGAITNNVQGWFSTGQVVPGFSTHGQAYDIVANAAVGFPAQPNNEYTLTLHEHAAAIHIASSVISTPVVWGAAGYTAE